MNSQRGPLLLGRSTCSWSRSFLGLTLLLIALLALGSCGGGGDESSSGATDPVVASCQGAIFIQAPVEAIDVNSQTLTLLGLTIHVDDFTRFHDANLADLAVGNTEVLQSGLTIVEYASHSSYLPSFRRRLDDIVDFPTLVDDVFDNEPARRHFAEPPV